MSIVVSSDKRVLWYVPCDTTLDVYTNICTLLTVSVSLQFVIKMGLHVSEFHTCYWELACLLDGGHDLYYFGNCYSITADTGMPDRYSTICSLYTKVVAFTQGESLATECQHLVWESGSVYLIMVQVWHHSRLLLEYVRCYCWQGGDSWTPSHMYACR